MEQRTCPRCKKFNALEARFCSRCGGVLVDEPAPAASRAPIAPPPAPVRPQIGRGTEPLNPPPAELSSYAAAQRDERRQHSFRLYADKIMKMDKEFADATVGGFFLAAIIALVLLTIAYLIPVTWVRWTCGGIGVFAGLAACGIISNIVDRGKLQRVKAGEVTFEEAFPDKK